MDKKNRLNKLEELLNDGDLQEHQGKMLMLLVPVVSILGQQFIAPGMCRLSGPAGRGGAGTG